jgi:hypothetical protein
MIEKQQEAQISLINYRNGGQPFMNLLTMIPIAWEDNGPITHFIGFQVDIVEQPGSVQNKNIGAHPVSLTLTGLWLTVLCRWNISG